MHYKDEYTKIMHYMSTNISFPKTPETGAVLTVNILYANEQLKKALNISGTLI